MKHLSLLLIIFLFFNATKAQKLPVNANSQLITYEEVVQAEGISKTELFLKAKKWFNNYYKNPNAVIKNENAEKGELKGVHKIRLQNSKEDGSKYHSGFVNYTIFIYIKEGRYKYKMTKFNYQDNYYHPVEKWINSTNTIEKDWLKQIDVFSKELIRNLKKHMLGEKEKSIDDW